MLDGEGRMTRGGEVWHVAVGDEAMSTGYVRRMLIGLEHAHAHTHTHDRRHLAAHKSPHNPDSVVEHDKNFVPKVEVCATV
ncbi:hypothetical protein J6590_046404 [Homalodisca vitripennis]|nr:hypothetical protein J6590_046404 [Homalodisca vitripennis]